MSVPGSGHGVSGAMVRRWVRHVLDHEQVGPAAVSVTFLSTQRMRALHRRALGRDRATDVIAFPLAHAGVAAGDVYVCPAFARRTARALEVSAREELLRLVVHGVLHALGHTHPPGPSRERSPMWRRQERYVQALRRGRDG